MTASIVTDNQIPPGFERNGAWANARAARVRYGIDISREQFEGFEMPGI